MFTEFWTVPQIKVTKLGLEFNEHEFNLNSVLRKKSTEVILDSSDIKSKG